MKPWLLVVAVPVLAYVVGLIALPHPTGLQAEQRNFDRKTLGTALSTTPTKPKRPMEVTLGGTVVIRGADLPEAALSRGARLPIKTHLGVTGVVDGDWQLFVHIDAQGGSFRIHGDHWPLRGQYKTGLWQPGEFLVDAWEGTVPMDAPAGDYDVWTGLYRGDDRMEVTAGDRKLVDDDRVRIGSITIE
ncbi:MAG: hypothetical protein Q8O67_09190 [Deltaproteobacteria bacterium]|nr:hypothetical protein [Deltaproteobacteria bacterium]